MAPISLRHVTKRYAGGPPAVDDVSLRVEDGELMILVGPSGCGKSTLLRMIAGLEDVTAGDVEIGGRRVNDVPARQRNLAMVFQSYALYPHLSVFENIAFPLRLRRLADAEVRKRVGRTAALLQLDEHLERRPAHLSGGQRQRVAMGRAIVREADAYLFDEPLSNLDAQLRGQMRTEISRLQRQLGVTTVYVTHDQVEAMTLGDRVAVLHRGVLQQVAPPRELYESPANLFVARFIGSPPMNLFPARLVGTTLELPFASASLPPGMAERAGGRDVLLAGIRPEHLATPRGGDGAPPGTVTVRLAVDVVEWLGNEQYGYIPFTAPPEVARRLSELASELGSEQLRTQLVVALDPSEGPSPEGVELCFDPARLHLFDPATGASLTAPARG